MESLSPGPNGGSLTVSVECNAGGRDSRDGGHPLIINADWTVTVPHDLRPERVAFALGSSPSCVPFVDSVVPAYRHFAEFASQVRQPVQDADGKWVASKAPGCGGSHRFDKRADATRHELSEHHLGARFGVPESMILWLIENAEQAWLATPDLSLVAEGREGLERLWMAGLHPLALPGLATAAPSDAGPLSMVYFLGRAYSETVNSRFEAATACLGILDLGDWARDFLGMSIQDTQAVLSLAWTPMSDDLVRFIVAHGLEAPNVDQVATLGHLTREEAARVVATWAAIDCYPRSRDFDLLSSHGAIGYVPRGGDIDRLVTDLASVGRPTGRTEAAIALAVVRSRSRIVRAALRVRFRGTLTAPTLIKFATTPPEGTP